MSRLNRLLHGVCVLGVFALPAAYGVAFWQWQRGVVSEPLPTLAVAETPKQVAKLDHAQLAALFGAVAAEPVEVPIKASSLSLKLLASYVGGKGRAAAVLASSENNHKLYYQGDQVLPGVELVTVQSRRVLIKRNGVLESVSLSGEQAGAAPVVRNPVAEQPQPVAAPAVKPLSQPQLAEKLNKLKALARGEM
ncbi:type II secretion system protein N [Atopomonas hussainii]|uniref:type II secretion system protein N n=1 Tax=Atopomonas hussainii TaxID=1429083 RepID=UPI0009F81235|nr:type II secretion system protein N [Atopomonas hussainii]